LGDIQEGEHLRMGWKGLWVSLAYTRAFGTLGPQFKSGQTHHNSIVTSVYPNQMVTKFSFDETRALL